MYAVKQPFGDQSQKINKLQMDNDFRVTSLSKLNLTVTGFLQG